MTLEALFSGGRKVVLRSLSPQLRQHQKASSELCLERAKSLLLSPLLSPLKEGKPRRSLVAQPTEAPKTKKRER